MKEIVNVVKIFQKASDTEGVFGNFFILPRNKLFQYDLNLFQSNIKYRIFFKFFYDTSICVILT